ncbi:methionyl-tRNA formyltransferase [Candidatus Saccharibacteria bacterium]|nr:methionyl-tRNA formyltransferase [Candidatus Saccharibacteria bacterium]
MRPLRSKKSSKPRLVFFGNERLATAVSTKAPVLRALVAAGYEVVMVVASHTEAVSRSRRQLEILDVAHAYHIPVLLPDKPLSIKDKLARTGAEAAVLVAYGRIIPPEIIEIFPKGIINIHPSLLPKLRGSTPVETTILNGLEETGVSLMKLTAEMDTGPVYIQKKIELTGSETKPELATHLLDEGCELLINNLDRILSGKLKPKPQDETEATYTRLLTKQDGQLDLKEPAEVIERKIRAFVGFPKARTAVFGREVVITKARLAISANDGNLVLKCQPGYLEVLELIAPSGRTMSGADFTRGYQKK